MGLTVLVISAEKEKNLRLFHQATNKFSYILQLGCRKWKPYKMIHSEVVYGSVPGIFSHPSATHAGKANFLTNALFFTWPLRLYHYAKFHCHNQFTMKLQKILNSCLLSIQGLLQRRKQPQFIQII